MSHFSGSAICSHGIKHFKEFGTVTYVNDLIVSLANNLGTKPSHVRGAVVDHVTENEFPATHLLVGVFELERKSYFPSRPKLDSNPFQEAARWGR